MSREIREIITIAVAQQDFRLLESLELDQSQLLSLHMQLPALLSDIRAIDDPRFTESRRKTLRALAKLIGPFHTICRATKMPIIDDAELLSELLCAKKYSDMEMCELRSRVLKAARAGQREVCKVLVPWCGLSDADMYEVWEASYAFDGKGDDFVFDEMMKSGAVGRVLRDARRGSIYISEAFLKHFHVHVGADEKESILKAVLKVRKK
jgi:hypothetical protein